MPDVLGFLASIGFAVPQEAIILLGLALLSIVYGLTIGRDRSIIPLLALYIAYVLTLHLPLVGRLNHWLTLPPSPTLSALWFMVFFLLGVFLFKRAPHITSPGREPGTWWEAILLAMLQIGLAICFIGHLVPATLVDQWPERLQSVFVGEWGKTFWMTAPLLFLLFVRRPYGYSSDLVLS